MMRTRRRNHVVSICLARGIPLQVNVKSPVSLVGLRRSNDWSVVKWAKRAESGRAPGLTFLCRTGALYRIKRRVEPVIDTRKCDAGGDACWRRVPLSSCFFGVHSSVVSTLHVSSRKPTSSDAVDCEQRGLVVNGLSQSDRRKKDFVRGWWIISAIMNSWKASKGIWFE